MHAHCQWGLCPDARQWNERSGNNGVCHRCGRVHVDVNASEQRNEWKTLASSQMIEVPSTMRGYNFNSMLRKGQVVSYVIRECNQATLTRTGAVSTKAKRAATNSRVQQMKNV